MGTIRLKLLTGKKICVCIDSVLRNNWLLSNAKVDRWDILVIDCCLTPIIYHGENKLHSRRWWPLCNGPTRLVGFFIVLPHWNNIQQVDKLLHSDTLPWFRANQSLLLLRNVVCSAEKRRNKYQFYGLWFDPTGAPTHGNISDRITIVKII